MGMGLLRKATIYREKYLNRPKKGLLKKALEYLESKNKEYPEIIENSNQAITDITIDTSLLREENTQIEDIDTAFNENDKDFEIGEDLTNIGKESKDLPDLDIENLQMELIEDLSKIEDIKEPEENEGEAELEEASLLGKDIEEGLEEEYEEEYSENEDYDEDNEVVQILEPANINFGEESLNNSKNLEDIQEVDEEVIENLEQLEEIESNNNIIENIKKENINEVTKNKFFDEEYISSDKYFKKKYFYNILNKISKNFATLVVNSESYKDFLKIIVDNFNISKSALLIYSPQKQKFVCWYSQNIDRESIEKLNFDLEFGNIYKNIAKEKSYFILPNSHNFQNLESLLSANDKNNSDFQLWVPFIFSARIIGILLSLQLYDRNIPEPEFIEALEIIGRLNGPLLYNLFQHYNLNSQKKNEIEDDLKEITEEKKREIDLEVVSKSENNNLSNEDIEIEESQLNEIFPERYHKLIHFTVQKLKENRNTFISFISIRLTNKQEIEENVPNFKVETFLSDIQFIAMNVTGTNAFLQVYDDISMIIILPEIKKSVALNAAKIIIDEINMMFNEIFGNISLKFNQLVLSFPEDSNNYIDIFQKLIKI